MLKIVSKKNIETISKENSVSKYDELVYNKKIRSYIKIVSFNPF